MCCNQKCAAAKDASCKTQKKNIKKYKEEKSMEQSPVFLRAFHNKTERILHMPGNFTGSILEMTLVLDAHVPAEQLKECAGILMRFLKQKNEVFRNVRFNAVYWKSDAEITTKVCPMLMAGTDSFYEELSLNKDSFPNKDFSPEREGMQEDPDKDCRKNVEKLYQFLKFYHARSKLVILLTDGCFQTGNEAEREEALKPFLFRKLITVKVTEQGMEL